MYSDIVNYFMMLLPDECIKISRETSTCVSNLTPQTIGVTVPEYP